MKKYYAAYEERYKTAHAHSVSWASQTATPIVGQTLEKYKISKEAPVLEIGCGEGRDSRPVLEQGYHLTATDISEEAIRYCREQNPGFADRFHVLDCVAGYLDRRFSFIFAVAVIHMLVEDADRDGFYRFIRDHLEPEGIALICTMGDGKFEMQSDITKAFTLQQRDHESGSMLVAGTSCRMVSFDTLHKELHRNGLTLLDQGLTSAMPDFNSLMYAVVKKGSLPR